MQQRTTQVLQIVTRTDDEVMTIDPKFSELDGEVTGEPMIRRKMVFDEDETVVEAARYIDDPLGCLIVINTTGQDRRSQPTKEEREADERAVLHVSDGANRTLSDVPVGRFAVLYPNIERFEISSESGQATATLVFIPQGNKTEKQPVSEPVSDG